MLSSVVRYAYVQTTSPHSLPMLQRRTVLSVGTTDRTRLLRRQLTSALALDNAHNTQTSEPSPGPALQLKYPHLFAPLNLGPDIGILPNRALMGSMHTGYVHRFHLNRDEPICYPKKNHSIHLSIFV